MRPWSTFRRPAWRFVSVRYTPMSSCHVSTARLKGAEPPRERQAQRADEREGRVHLRRAQHLPVAIDEVAETRLRGDELDGDEGDERQPEAEPETGEDRRRAAGRITFQKRRVPVRAIVAARRPEGADPSSGTPASVLMTIWKNAELAPVSTNAGSPTPRMIKRNGSSAIFGTGKMNAR